MRTVSSRSEIDLRVLSRPPYSPQCIPSPSLRADVHVENVYTPVQTANYVESSPEAPVCAAIPWRFFLPLPIPFLRSSADTSRPLAALTLSALPPPLCCARCQPRQVAQSSYGGYGSSGLSLCASPRFPRCTAPPLASSHFAPTLPSSPAPAFETRPREARAQRGQSKQGIRTQRIPMHGRLRRR